AARASAAATPLAQEDPIRPQLRIGEAQGSGPFSYRISARNIMKRLPKTCSASHNRPLPVTLSSSPLLARPALARFSAAVSQPSGFSCVAVEHPADAVGVDQHAELGAPERVVEGHRDI